MKKISSPPTHIDTTVQIPGDKSISQRAIILNSMAYGQAHVSNLCEGDDRSSVLRCVRRLGVRIRKHRHPQNPDERECFAVKGMGSIGFVEPTTILNAGNSGTAIRLLSGLLAAQPFFSVITGDESLRSRPMGRIVQPLKNMGAIIMGRDGGSFAPMAFQGGSLKAIDYLMPVASAQVKSSLLIAGLFADGTTTLTQPSESRDHTERMLQAMGADINIDGLAISISQSRLDSIDVKIPGDMSSAAFWIVAGCCHPDSRIRLAKVGINTTRAGLLDVLREMGASIKLENIHNEGTEPVADIIAETSSLRGIRIGGPIIPKIIDELPILSLAATQAKGTTVIEDASELRVKESDRIRATVEGLSRLGAKIEERPDGIVIKGGQKLYGNSTNSHGDHRIAMMMGIAGLLAKGQTTIEGAESASVSYPEFWDTLYSLNT